MSTTFEKLEKNGKVAVLISPGFGWGWSTWNPDQPGLLFDKEIAAAILAKDRDVAEKIAVRKYPDAYLGGLSDLTVKWVKKGERFEVREYDGSESLRFFEKYEGFIA